MSNKTGTGLAAYAISLLGAAYAYGVQGVVLTEALLHDKANQYPEQYDANYIKETRNHSLGRVSYDCTTPADLYTGVDRSANGWFGAATEKGPIAEIPEIVGLMVHKHNHMGIYIGNGWVIEARGVEYGVVKTRLSDRPWQHWAKIPGVTYIPAWSVARTLKTWFPRMRGTDVLQLEYALERAGYLCNISTTEKSSGVGVFGSGCDSAVRAFQADHPECGTNGKPDGKAGPKTIALLGGTWTGK